MSGRELKQIFDEDPGLYQRARPGYPDELFRDLADLAGIGSGARVLEIGPGTGQATRALAALGARVTALELGPALARVLRERTAEDDVEVVVSAFEDWPLPEQPFDLVVAFTSWHWLDPAVRGGKSAAGLVPGGWLATVTTTHVAGGTNDFFARAQACYEQWDPSTPAGLRLLGADAVAAAVDEVDVSDLFLPAVRRRYHQDVEYTTDGYLDVLRTYSGHRALTPQRRDGLLACIGGLIDGRYGGTITKRYLYELRVARRRSSG
jgi:SAM-dependent methyltransferase